MIVSRISDHFDFLKKSQFKAGDGLDTGTYPFYTSSTQQSKFLNQYLYRPGCIVFGTGGKASIHLAQKHFATSADCITIAPKKDSNLVSEYLFQYLKHNIHILERGFKGAGLKHISKAYISKLLIPHPEELYDQKRIAYLLSKVEGLIKKRKQQLQDLDDFLKSVFLDMFGDPVRNEKGWDSISFDQVGKFKSGGTPSKKRKDYWNGNFPWVSPKDMKTSRIQDSSNHISKTVFAETSQKKIKPGHLLIVVRGMILAHSFPVAINNTTVSINQDMKAIEVISDFSGVYLEYCLLALKRRILKLISTAGHGTKKFDSTSMQKLFIPKPPRLLQEKFVAIAAKVENVQDLYSTSLDNLQNLYGSLSQKAFSGELDLSRVPVPIEVKEEIQMKKETTFEEIPEIELPENNEHDIDTDEGRKAIIKQWFEHYQNVRGCAAIEVHSFIELANQRLQDLMDDPIAIDVETYDLLSSHIQKQLAAGSLSQGYDSDSNRVILTRN